MENALDAKTISALQKTVLQIGVLFHSAIPTKLLDQIALLKLVNLDKLQIHKNKNALDQLLLPAQSGLVDNLMATATQIDATKVSNWLEQEWTKEPVSSVLLENNQHLPSEDVNES